MPDNEGHPISQGSWVLVETEHSLAAEMEAKKRKVDSESFHEEWTNLYFFIKHNSKPTCLLCKETKSSFKEQDLKSHYELKHKKKYGDLLGSDRDEKITKLRRDFEHDKRHETEAELRASYRVAHILCKDLRPFSDGEYVKKCMLAVVEEMYPEKRNTFKSVNLATVIVIQRVEDMGKNLHLKLKSRATRFEMFSIAADELVDSDNNVYFLVFIRGINSSFEITEELAAVKCMKSGSSPTTVDFFKEVSDVIQDHGLPWNKLVGVTTNGAISIMGNHNGLAGRISKKVVESNGSRPLRLQCIIHQQSIYSKVLNLDHVTKIVFSIINYIKTRELNHVLFKELVTDLESEYEDILPENELTWLGGGKLIRRFFDLRYEIDMFMTQRSRPVTQLKDPSWLWDLAIMCDIMLHLDELNMKLQKSGKLISHLYADVTAFIAKVQLFIHQAEKATLIHFPTCAALGQDEKLSTKFPKKRMTELLGFLKDNFNYRFIEFENLKEEIRLFENPFAADASQSPHELQLELIDLQSQTALFDKFRTMQPVEFYSKLPAASFPNLRNLALKMITMFTSTHVCEEASKIIHRARSTLKDPLINEHLDSVIRIGVSSIKPDINSLVSSKTSKSSPSTSREHSG